MRSSFRSKALLFVALLASVHATITCLTPVSGTFKAGDALPLSWGSDEDIVSMTATLFCDSGLSVSSIPITNFTAPYTWTVPSVGNATTGGGTTGTCPANSFHVEYSGVTVKALIIRTNFDVRCASLTILPAPNNTVTTTTMTTIASTTTATKPTKTKSGGATPTNAEDTTGSKPKTFIIVIVAIVAGLVVIMLAFGTWWYLRRQRIQRMQEAIMPWSSPPNNQFAKISSMDEGHRAASVNNHGGQAGGAAAASAAAAGGYSSSGPKSNIPQPAGYYPGDGYGYGQQGAEGGYGGNSRQPGYDGYGQNEDEYYNPYYAQARQGGPSPSLTSTSYYSGSSRTPFQDPRDPFQQPGYFPPPPPVSVPSSSGAQGMMLMSPTLGVAGSSSATSVPNTSTTTLTSIPSLRRAPQAILPEMPQTILPEMGHKEEDAVHGQSQGIPMKDLS
ncbi:hypothetical protein BGZ98_010227 [Dissophora globulifera]|nr:hypothetical protein BGZ98_010227 [Dissophora globulifera]